MMGSISRNAGEETKITTSYKQGSSKGEKEKKWQSTKAEGLTETEVMVITVKN